MSKPIEILLQDDFVLAVNKPSGVMTIPGRKGEVGLGEAIANNLGISGELRMVHRLDRETSGIMLMAKTLEAQRDLSRQFRKRTVYKSYLAIVRDALEEGSGVIDAPLGPHPHIPSRTIVPRKKGRPSQTEWEVVERFGSFALVRCHPLTGRQDQIRVHLAHAGMPLLVDEAYGQKAEFKLSEVKQDYRQKTWREERPLIARLTLHAEKLEFDHPGSGERVTVEAEPPKDFRATITQLGRQRFRR